MIIAGIPAHNEAAHIKAVILGAKVAVDRVLVLDDGSSDDTAAIAREAGAQVIIHQQNRGYGGAISSLFQAALEAGAEALITLDGDGQHDPSDLPEVLAPVMGGQADLVIGSRFLGKANNVPRYRRFGIDVITFLYNVGHPPPISDAQSGMRCFSRGVLEALQLHDPGMGLSVEVLIKARNRGFKMVEVPISCRYHGEGSSLHPVRHGVGVAWKVLEHRLRDRAGR